jgi:hypothetical protein
MTKLETVSSTIKSQITGGRLAGVLGLTAIVILMLFGASSAKSVDDAVQFPTGFHDWYAVNALTAPKESPVFGGVEGVHIIHVNAKGLATLKKGGPLPYPDGTIFADEVHSYSIKDGATFEGPKIAVTVMVKDAKKYPTTGGWGFQVFAGGDPTKPQLPNVAASIPACFNCHTPQKANDWTFSTYIP